MIEIAAIVAIVVISIVIIIAIAKKTPIEQEVKKTNQLEDEISSIITDLKEKFPFIIFKETFDNNWGFLNLKMHFNENDFLFCNTILVDYKYIAQSDVDKFKNEINELIPLFKRLKNKLKYDDFINTLSHSSSSDDKVITYKFIFVDEFEKKQNIAIDYCLESLKRKGEEEILNEAIENIYIVYLNIYGII